MAQAHRGMKVQVQHNLGGPQEVSKKQRRETENSQALGCMRAPHRAVDRLPRVAVIGRKIRRCLETFLEQHPEAVEQRCPTYGSTPKGFKDTDIGALRGAILMGQPYTNLAHKGLSPDIISAWCKSAGDPDGVLADWLEQGGSFGCLAYCGSHWRISTRS